MSLTLGNLLPGQEVLLSLTIVEEVEIVGGAYCFSCPASFYPDYSRHELPDGIESEVMSEYQI